MYDPKPVELANQFHQATYATPATVQAYAPGRIEILGNHTDYNAGTTLSTRLIGALPWCYHPPTPRRQPLRCQPQSVRSF